MRKLSLLTSLAVAVFLTAAPVALQLPMTGTAAYAQDATVSFSVFFNDLKPHGVWVKSPKYQYVFCPRVDAGWRPYTNGRWIYIKDRGWYFDSEEPFAWALYHYGRWIDDERIGWCWVPGNHWAPAWVSWRRSNDHVGWAPLPPDNDGFQINIKITVGEPPERDWVFVPARSFLAPDLRATVVLADRDPDVYRRSQFVGPVVIQNNVVINNVIKLDFIEQQTNQKVPVVETKAATDPAKVTTEPSAGTIQVFAPKVDEPKKDEAPPAAVEADQAKQQLGAPAGANAPAAEAPATPAAQCPEGQQLVDGKCVPATAQPGKPKTEQPAAQTPAQPAPPEGKPAADHKGAPADNSQAAPAAGTPAAEPAKPAEAPACADGEHLVKGKCVPMKDNKKPAAGEQPAAQQPPAEKPAKAAPAEQAPAVEPAKPAAEPAKPAVEPAKCPEGERLVQGKCLPMKGGKTSDQQPATEQPAAQPSSAEKPKAAPADAQAAPSDKATPKDKRQQCPEGQHLVRGKCLPIEGEAAPAQGEAAPAQ